MDFIGGIDEAGRGPLIGPLIICFCTSERKNERLLKKSGATDSKALSPKKREEIFQEIKEFCTFKVEEISAEDLTKQMKIESLNDIEARVMANFVKKSHNCDIMIDMPDRYAWTFKERMNKFGATKFEAEHKADANYPIVGAASICAKITRDKKIEEIKNEVGFDFGSGYPSDPKTKETILDKNKLEKLHKYIRWEWETMERLKQRKLFDD